MHIQCLFIAVVLLLCLLGSGAASGYFWLPAVRLGNARIRSWLDKRQLDQFERLSELGGTSGVITLISLSLSTLDRTGAIAALLTHVR